PGARVDGRPESSRWPCTPDHRRAARPIAMTSCRCYPPARSRPTPETSRPMAKRSRLGARPGQRRPLQRPTSRPDGTSKPGGLTREELARAAELEAQILAEEEAAQETRRGRERARER